LILILSKYRFRVWNGEQDRKLYVEFLEKKTRRLLFQSMMKAVSPIEKKKKFQRSDEDDEDLLEVLQVVQELDKGKDEGPTEGESSGI
jgi:hypothetical protein